MTNTNIEEFINKEEANVIAVIMLTDLLESRNNDVLTKIGANRVRAFVNGVADRKVEMTHEEQSDFVANLMDKLFVKLGY